MNGLRRITGTGRIAAAATAVAAALLVVGCGSSFSTGSDGAAASLKRAAYVSSAAPGYQIDMAMQITGSDQGSASETANLTANGSFSPGSRTGQMTMSMQVPNNAPINMSMVMNGDTMYMKFPYLTSRLPGVKPWLTLNLKQAGKAAGIPGYGSMFDSGSDFSDPGQYLEFLRATSDGSVDNLGTQTVNGVPITQYQADVDLAKLPDAVPAADKSAIQQLVSTLQSKGVNTQMPVDAWIDASHHIRRIQISYSFSVDGASLRMDLTENVSDYGPQPAPTIPSAGQTTNLLSLIKGG